MMSLQVVREFQSEVEAALAAATLRANGIEVEMRPVGFGFPGTLAGRTAVVARSADVVRARAVLDAPGN